MRVPGHGEQMKQVLQISISFCEIIYKLCCLWIQLLGQQKLGWMAEVKTGVSHTYAWSICLVTRCEIFQCISVELQNPTSYCMMLLWTVGVVHLLIIESVSNVYSFWPGIAVTWAGWCWGRDDCVGSVTLVAPRTLRNFIRNWPFV